jgi:hypothetical protein
MEQIYNNPASPTTLSAAISSTSATSLSVTSGTGYPSSGTFRIQIDAEIMEVTAVSGTTWTVTRGAESSTAATHSSGATVNIVLTAAGISQILSDSIETGTLSSLPSSPRKGQSYSPTDNPIELVYNGSSWNSFGPSMSLSIPPASSTLTAVGTPTATITDTSYGWLVTGAANAGYTYRTGVSRTAPWRCSAFMMGTVGPQNYTAIGIGAIDETGGSNNGKGVQLLFSYNGSYTVVIQKVNSDNSYNSTYTNTNWSLNAYNGIWFSIYDNGTDRYYQTSMDGINWLTMYSTANTDWCSANQGEITGGGSSSYGVNVRYLSFSY